MNEYLHHVPGRMRIRARLFRSESLERTPALRRLRAISGISDLRLNEKPGSVTVYCDTGEITGEALLETLQRDCPQATVPAEPAARQPALPRTYQRPIAAEIGKVALNMLASKGVSYSLSALLRTRI